MTFQETNALYREKTLEYLAGMLSWDDYSYITDSMLCTVDASGARWKRDPASDNWVKYDTVSDSWVQAKPPLGDEELYSLPGSSHSAAIKVPGTPVLDSAILTYLKKIASKAAISALHAATKAVLEDKKQEKTKKCSCGTENFAEAKFCHACGKKFASG